MPVRLALSPLSTAVSMRRALKLNVLPSALALAVSLPVAGYVQAQEFELNIPAQPLSTALQVFGQQTNLQILYSPDTVKEKRSSAVSGKMDPVQAIERLLGGTGVSYSLQGSSMIINAPGSGTDAVELGATQINANQLGTITEGSGSYTPGTIATATKMVLTPRETPQSISVVTRQTMDDFGLNGIDDVMRHTPGITVSTFDSERTNYYSRGFPIQNFQYDGVPTTRNEGYSAGQTLSDMAIYDRVEILKGTTGLMTGAGGPGGTINLVRKKPTAEFQGHVGLGAGSWDNYRSELDVSGPLTDSGNVRGRAVVAYQDKHSFIDHYERKTNVYYGILEFDLSPDTLLTVGADYQNNDPKGSSWSGSRSLFDGAGNDIKFDRGYNNGPKWSSWGQYSRSVFATLEHALDNGWVAKANYSNQLNGYNAPLGYASPIEDSTDRVSVYGSKFTGKTISNNGDFYLSGPFSLGGREHQLVVGSSISRSHWEGNDYYGYEATYRDSNNFPMYEWNGDSLEPQWGPAHEKDDITRQAAVYFSTRLSLTDDLSLLLGSRLTDYRLTGTNDSRETGKLIPYAGVVYDLNKNFSVYGSYTSIFMPQQLRPDRNNKMVEPDEGENYEIGLKGEFYDGRLNASLAYFEIHESNRAEEDSEYNNNMPANSPVEWAYMGVQAKTKGYEAEISGELLPGWQVQAGYTHKVIRDDDGKKFSTWEPQDQLNFYTSYKLTGALDKLTLGGGARWQGEAWQDVYNRGKRVTQRFSQDPYWLVDAMARYQITKNLSASLNVNNVFDKRYYTNIGFYTSSYSGDPRNVMVSTRWDF
ncbi:outer-membrane receptor for ferric coprogen and ferric-rhodotorulic acid [Pseudomonas cedrina]|uniref:Ligand-gated channel n=2 Tax=Pseudomonas cedrina TaxID=651740 RepID=A0A1V2K6F9_PSECE|nr:ligand-gated channel [Pseudomonas cedrina subsp. cedrina]SDS42983.1 outer-membrane receptor for ferric coprogen and ferric-rhodotorulic acid [Pseudomonas cedrina]